MAGQELGVTGTCVACPLGTYRSEWDTGFFCGPCSYGWTTENEGATDQTQCSISRFCSFMLVQKYGTFITQKSGWCVDYCIPNS